MEAQLMKVVKKFETETVTKLSTKYGFDLAEALAYLHPAEEEKARGRPEKKKRVVNKEQMVTDVIQSLLADAEKEKVVAEDAEVVAVAEVIAVEKKKVTKKKAPVVTEAAVEAAKEVAPVVTEPSTEKKKVVTKKKAAVVEEAAAVVAVAEPATEKKKAVTKKKSPAPAEEVAPVVTEPSTEKKKVVTKKKAPVAEEAPAVVVVPEPVKKVAEPVVEKELEAEAATEEEDDDETTATEWTHEGVVYYKMCDNRCGKDNCTCTGAVYNKETQDCVGTWNGTELEEPTESDDEE